MGEKEKLNQTASDNKQDYTVLHGQSKDGKVHAVFIGSLKVVLVQDGPKWFAQGLDIDYAAEGSNVEEAKHNFESGLVASVDMHLKVYSNLSKLLKPAPQDVWQEMFYGPIMGQNKTLPNKYHQLTIHSCDGVKKFTLFEDTLFEGIQYFELAEAA